MIRRNISWRPQLTATPSRREVQFRSAEAIGPQDNYNSSVTKATAAVAAAGARAPLLYGYVQTKGLIAAVKVVDMNSYSGMRGLYLLVVWGEGEIESIEYMTAGGVLSTIERHDYLGTVDQAVDPWLSVVISGYADTLRGTVNERPVSLAYSVLRVMVTESFPEDHQATIKGLKIYDPRLDDIAYSSNPALILCDLLTRAGETVDWAGSLDAINICDEDVHGQPRWSCSLVINSAADVSDYVEKLRGYAHCLIDHTPIGIRLVPDVETEVSRALTASDIVAGSLTLSRPAQRDTPTVVRISYTDTAPPAGPSNGPWGRAWAMAQHPGIVLSQVPWIEAGVTMEGIQSKQQAWRSAVERLNAYTLRNLWAECTIRDEGLALAVGDVVTLTHAIGLDTKPMRVLSVDDAAPGRYKLRLEEYDPAVYSSAITDDPTYPDGSLPSPFSVPAPGSVNVVEEVYQQLDGTYASRLVIDWSEDDYPYAHHYDVRVFRDGVRIFAETGPDAEAVTPPILPRHTYEVRVRIAADIGINGPWASVALYVEGKNFPPTDIATLNAAEMGGEVRLSWTSAFDTDFWRYEIRWGAVSGSWETATLLDRVDTLRLVTKDIPPGTWRFWVKALDSIGQYSANAASRDVEVTLDNSAFFVGDASLAINSGSSVACFADTDRFGNFRAWSEQGTVVNTLLPNVANTYTGLACTHDLGGSSLYTSETWDLGAIGTADSYSGNLAINVDAITTLAGSITTETQTSLNGSSWTSHAETSLRTELAYAKVTASAASGNGFLITGNPYLRLDVFAREETGIVTTSASGATTVTLDNAYFAAKNIQLAPSGTAPRSAVYDNIVTGDPTHFDVYLFDASNNQIAGQVSWQFQGV